MSSYVCLESIWETEEGCEVPTGLMMMATEQCQRCLSGVCIVGFGPISLLLFVFRLLVFSG